MKTDDPIISKMMLRIPDPLHTAIKIEAAKNRRSANAEVLHHLEKLYVPYTGDEGKK